jgi:hypothetical protein
MSRPTRYLPMHYKVSIDDDWGKYQELFDYCSENCVGNWKPKIMLHIEFGAQTLTGSFLFELASDAVEFKLRFG